MKIRSLHLKNFRGYRDFVVDFSSELNVIIGKNDIGKSTILEALDIFFNSDRIKMEMDDLCVYKTSLEIEISVCFEIDINKEYLIETVPTSLSKEYLLNKDGLLEICKKWDCSNGKLGASNLKEFIRASYPIQYKESPLISLKITQLKKIYADLEEAITIKGIKARKNTNTEMRQAIYDVSDITHFESIDIPIDKIEGKDIWSNISIDFPMYFLFQADRANKDTDKEVQDPLKAITKTAIDEVVDELEKVKKIIEEKAELIGKETIKKLAEINPELANVLHPEISNRAWDSLFSFSFIGDDNIPINKRGSGVRRMILLSYFRAEAERKSSKNRNIIYAIEEPETSQHPNHQKLLIYALQEIASKDTHTVIITTHSPEVAKKCKNENLILIDKKGLNKIVIEEEFKLSAIVRTLGISGYLSKLVICVEGQHDKTFLTKINQSIPEIKSIIDLKKCNISILPMQGRNLEDWIQGDYLRDTNVTEFHLYDKDEDEKYKEKIAIVNARNNGSFGLLTQMREMENYIHPRLYEKQFGIPLTHLVDDWEISDIPDLILREQHREDYQKWDADRIKISKKVVKNIANGKLSSEMTKSLFVEMGVYDEVESWFTTIKEMYEV